ncbi:MAG: S1/P1 Nuclease [Thalassobius sp.]|nr:S1/P1 Nuclease [Thalassovita sp.]
MYFFSTSVFFSFFSEKSEKKWGFTAHKLINRTAVFLLPQEMLAFYKQNIQLIEESSVNPDARRYLIEGEAPKHYIDLDLYKEDVNDSIPITWKKAVEKYSVDSLTSFGIVPWHIYSMSFRLTKAFEQNNPELILKYSAEIGHYIADANVPLHTTSNYNGQLTNQYGIHGLWESRLVELFTDDYDLLFEDATYLDNPLKTAWSAVRNANACLDSVLSIEKLITEKIGEDKKFSFEERNNATTKVYSTKFCEAYHNALNNQVERRLRASIKMVADFWFTCWVNAGQPSLNNLSNYKTSEKVVELNKQELLKGKQNPIIKSRKHEIIE